MTTRGNTLMQKLILYGNSGSDSVLTDIIGAVQRGEEFGTIKSPLALKVSQHIFRILDQGTKPNMILPAMNCIKALCESHRNSEAKSFVKSLQSTTILKHCVHGCRQPDAGQRYVCIFILLLYAADSDKRRCEMLQFTGLLEAVMLVVDSFSPNYDEQAIKAVKYGIVILQWFWYCSHPLDRIVRAGGRQILDALLPKAAIISEATLSVPDELYTEVVVICTTACRTCYAALIGHHTELIEAGVPVTDIFYDTEQAVHIMESWYRVFINSWAAQNCAAENLINNIITSLVFCTSSYAQTDSGGIVATGGETGAMMCKIFALKTSSLGTTSDPFVAFVLKLAVQLERDNLASGEREAFAGCVFRFVWQYPSLKAVVEEHVGKYRYCAHPDCTKSSFVHGALRKCARCRSHSVWYCGKEHQIAHWPEHKLTCKRHDKHPKPNLHL